MLHSLVPVMVPLLPVLQAIGQYALLIFTGAVAVARAITAIRDLIRWLRRRSLQKILQRNRTKPNHHLQVQRLLLPQATRSEEVHPIGEVTDQNHVGHKTEDEVKKDELQHPDKEKGDAA